MVIGRAGPVEPVEVFEEYVGRERRRDSALGCPFGELQILVGGT